MVHLIKQVIDLLQNIDRTGTVFFYPSSCSYQEEFQALPFDNVILNSRSFRENCKIGKVFCTNIDNNALLGVFKKLDINITDIVIIRDGCMEGGNYECCSRSNFLGKAIGIQKSSFNVYSCHGFSRVPDIPANIESAGVPEFVSMLRFFSDPLGDQRGFKISPRTYDKKEFKLGQIKVGIRRESITASLADYDLVLLRDSFPLINSFQSFVKGEGLHPKEKFFVIKSQSDASFKEFLERAKNSKWQKVAALPFGKGRYQNVLSEIEEHSSSSLQEIDFYHLHKSDYRQIYRKYRKECVTSKKQT